MSASDVCPSAHNLSQVILVRLVLSDVRKDDTAGEQETIYRLLAVSELL
ncbi:hypothetical protein SynRS9915_01477 [Synechococcus sp. RS9915]|nr:hypothetical protein SynRS9915_01477 [Synechococcus sp. RS9915]